LFSETVFPSIFARIKGWKESLSKAGEYAMFSRTFTRSEWDEYEATRRQNDRFDRAKVHLEDTGWDEYERGVGDRIAASLGKLRSEEYRENGISDVGKRGEISLADSYAKKARGFGIVAFWLTLRGRVW